MGGSPAAARNRRIRSRLLLAVCFVALLAAIAAGYFAQRDAAPQVKAGPAAAGNEPLAIERVSFVSEPVGAYHSQGPAGRPAWELSRDPALVNAYGNGNDGVVLVRCNCGLTIRMLGQVVDARGYVMPSIWHDVPECGWHVWGRFEGWENGVWNTAGKEDSPQRH